MIPDDAGGVAEAAPQHEVTTAPVSPVMEKATAAVVLVFGLAMLVGARGIVVRNETGGIDPRWWPTAIAIGIIGCGVWMLVNAVLGIKIDREVDASRRSGWIQTGATVAAIILVLVLWHVGVSFLVLGPAFLIGMNWVYGLRNKASLLLFPAIVLVLLFLVFQLLLKVPL